MTDSLLRKVLFYVPCTKSQNIFHPDNVSCVPCCELGPNLLICVIRAKILRVSIWLPRSGLLFFGGWVWWRGNWRVSVPGCRPALPFLRSTAVLSGCHCPRGPSAPRRCSTTSPGSPPTRFRVGLTSKPHGPTSDTPRQFQRPTPMTCAPSVPSSLSTSITHCSANFKRTCAPTQHNTT